MSLLDIQTIIQENTHIYAHTHKDKAPELLEEHLSRVVKYFEKVIKEKKLNGVIEHFKEALGGGDYFKELLKGAIYFHDLGKINLNFQDKQMNNEYFKYQNTGYTDHAMLSSLIYIDYYLTKFKLQKLSQAEMYQVTPIILLNAYVISRHHSHMSSWPEFKRKLEEVYRRSDDEDLTKLLINPIKVSERMLQKLEDITEDFLQINHVDWEKTESYIYTRWAYSILVACDFYATSEYIEGEKIQDLGLLTDIERWRGIYQETGIYKKIQQYKETRDTTQLEMETSINNLRSEMFLEATEHLNNAKDQFIYYLEAPTGSGKTNTSINLILELLQQDRNLQKIFYIFPFNTLAEQTYKSLTKTFEGASSIIKDITVVNSITPIKNRQEKEQGEDRLKDIEYSHMLLDRQFFHYPLVITSHIQFFNLLFSPDREQIGGLYQLCNSVIIIDEVQSYKNTLWTEIIGFLERYAKLLNIRIIIMSATLPPLGELIGKTDVVSLIQDREKYFNHKLFKERVQLDFSLLEEENVLKTLLLKVLEYSKERKKILVEFIKKKSAVHFYNELIVLKEEGELEQEVLLITGDDSKWERELAIDKVRESQDVILIATQVIEAGVDIDMDIGFKDISLLDAEEQFLGRINRSCLKENCKVYFFNLDEAATIYKGDYRKQKRFTLLEEVNQNYLMNKDFRGYYKGILEEVKAFGVSQNQHNVKRFLGEAVGVLESLEIYKHMQLIEEDLDVVSIFLAREISIYDKGKEIRLNGAEIWSEYKTLLIDKEMPYAQRKVKLSQLNEWMSCFIWKVKYTGQCYNDRVGELYYIEEGERYFTNGKFDREKLSDSSYELL